ncbi:DUF4258 domain-containing protein [Caldicellulosiruptoraceae bacterium PP1]
MSIGIDEIRKLAKEEKIQWCGHMMIRMKERGITIYDVFEAINNGEIIEIYEKDYPFPSCLILGYTNEKKPIHVICSIGNDFVWFITSYFPTLDEWLEDYKTRRDNK